jgi:hypothetical protein
VRAARKRGTARNERRANPAESGSHACHFDGPSLGATLLGSAIAVGYTSAVPSVGDDLRTRTHRRVLEMAVAERIALALSLGDQDLALFVAASGLSAEEAKQRLRTQRQRGRTPSACASAPAR